MKQRFAKRNDHSHVMLGAAQDDSHRVRTPDNLKDTIHRPTRANHDVVQLVAEGDGVRVAHDRVDRNVLSSDNSSVASGSQTKSR